MRIGIDARILQGDLRGQGQYVYYLIRNLLAVDTRNEYVLFYNGLRPGRFAFDGSAPNLKQVWCRFPGRWLGRLWPAAAFPPVEAFIGDLDVFHNPINFNFTHYTPVPSKAKMAATFNGMADPADIWEKYDLNRINRWFEIIAARAAQVIVVSESVRADLLRRVKIPEKRITTVYYGVGEEFRPIPDRCAVDSVLSKYGLEGKRYILYVGAAEKNKNIAGLLKAFCSLLGRREGDGLYLVLAGSIDEHYRGVLAMARELAIADRVVCPGYIGHDELPCVYNGARVFVLPTFNEWFGIPLLEAMACGVPVAASRARGVPEVTADAALLFDPHDTGQIAEAITSILADGKLRETLVGKGCTQARKFTWENTARATLDVYRKALEE